MDFIIKDEINEFELIKSLMNEMQNAFILQQKVNEALQEQINHLNTDLEKVRSELQQVIMNTGAY
jgi:hypothetical protein